MGKKKVPVVLIKNLNNRRNTFSKRLIGLMKKAHDLSILCNAKIAVVAIDEQEVIYPYTNNKSIEEIWKCYSAENPQEKRERIRLEFCKEKLRSETEKAEKARLAKNDTNQEDYANNSSVELQEHHDTLQNTESPSNPQWNNQHTNCGSSSSSTHDYDFSTMVQNGSNMFLGQIPMIDANGNNWLFHTNSNNFENNQQTYHEQNIPIPNANGNIWLPNTNATNYENNPQPNQEYHISNYENNVHLNLQDINEAFENHSGGEWVPELNFIPDMTGPGYPGPWGPAPPITPARWEGFADPATELEPPPLNEKSVSEMKDEMP